MTKEIDDFANSLLEEAKRFFERSCDCEEAAGQTAFSHAAIMLAFCALEAHVNSIADEFEAKNVLSLHEKGFLLEREVRINSGRFELTGSLKMARLDDRIEFLHRHFSGVSLDRTTTWWSDLQSAIKLRNALTHPKEAKTISKNETERAIRAVVETLDAIFNAVYKRGLPSARRGLQSQLSF